MSGDLEPFPADEFEYKVVAERLAERIRRGEFAANGRLPSEPRLCEHYGVGLGVVRHARQELVQRGLIYVRQGWGTFIA